MDSCPSCRRKFSSVLDFPKVVVHKVERQEMPRHHHVLISSYPAYVKKSIFQRGMQPNPEIPEEVHRAFQNGEKHITLNRRCYAKEEDHGRAVYWAGFDYAPQLTEKSVLPGVVNTISFLESILKKEITREELRTGLALDYINGLFIGGQEIARGSMRMCHLSFGYGTMTRLGGDYLWDMSAVAAQVLYEGRLQGSNKR